MAQSNDPPRLIQIQHLNRKGRGVGSLQKTPTSPLTSVDVVGAVPGDTVLALLGSKRRGRCQGQIQEIITPSPLRVFPKCIHVPVCGGCSLQQMDYSAQLKEKQAFIQTTFSSVISSHTEVRPIIPCQNPWQYRNKMEFSFSQNRAGERFLGLMIAGSKGKVLNLSECHLCSPWMIDLLSAVRLWWEGSGLEAYRMNDTGSLRTLIMREGIATGDQMVMLTVSGNPDYALTQAHLKGFIQALSQALPEEKQKRLSVFLRIQQIQKGSPTQFYEMHLHGPDHIIEKLQIQVQEQVVDLQFKISPTSFFQPNTLQAEKLYGAALSLVPPCQHVLDLYAGTATLGLSMALRAKQVTAVELNPAAVFDAESNKALNGINNLELICGDVGAALDRLVQEPHFTPPDLVIIDPPRCGLDPLAIAQIVGLKPPFILYISCNPLSQAENMKSFIEHGYQVDVIQPVDQFPHTVHIENIVLLKCALFA